MTRIILMIILIFVVLPLMIAFYSYNLGESVALSNVCQAAGYTGIWKSDSITYCVADGKEAIDVFELMKGD